MFTFKSNNLVNEQTKYYLGDAYVGNGEKKEYFKVYTFVITGNFNNKTITLEIETLLKKEFFDTMKMNERKEIKKESVTDVLVIEDLLAFNVNYINEFAFYITKVDKKLYEIDFIIDQEDIKFKGTINI